MSRSSKRILFLLAAWAAIIFLSSCTFIERKIFVDSVEKSMPLEALRYLWLKFWDDFGVFIVKSYHMAEFSGLCYLLFLSLNRCLGRKPSESILGAVLLSILYAVSDEWHQTFVPGRRGTWVDVLIDGCGIGFCTIFILWKIRRSRLKGKMKSARF